MTDALPVVFVPGMLCDDELWSDVTAELDVTAVHAAIDAPTIEGMAQQVLAATTGRFVLAGLSLGAIVGFEVLRLQPDRVAGFCAISTNAGAPTVAQYQAWHGMGNRAAHGEFHSTVEDFIVPTMFAEAVPSDNRHDRFMAMAARVGPRRFRAQLSAQADRTSAVARLRSVRCPSLVISAGSDALCPPAFHQVIAESIPDSRLELLPDAGHLCTWEEPNRIAQLISEWLPAVTRTSRTPQELTCP